jgi:hypothetical protein
VESGLSGGLTDPFEAATAGIAFGSERFLKDLRKRIRELNADKEVPAIGQLRQTKRAPRSESIITSVNEEFWDFSRCQRQRLQVYCLDQVTRLARKEIAELTDRSNGAVTKAIAAIERKLSNDHDLRIRLGRVLKFEKENFKV